MKFIITLGSNTAESNRIKPVCNAIEKKIQALLSRKKYGNGVLYCQYNLFCDSMEFYKTNYRIKFFTPERLPDVLQEGKFEINHWIDSDQIDKSDQKETYRIICESILKSLYRLAKIKKFDYQAFHDDIIDLFREEGWIYIQFFMTGEIESSVNNKLNFFGTNSIAGKIKSYVSARDYGPGVSDWAHIVICMTPDTYEAGFFKEIKKYTKKDKEVELRLRIDYDEMLTADENEVNKLICESILRGVDIVEHELKVKDFNFGGFRDDLIVLFKKEHWI